MRRKIAVALTIVLMIMIVHFHASPVYAPVIEFIMDRDSYYIPPKPEPHSWAAAHVYEHSNYKGKFLNIWWGGAAELTKFELSTDPWTGRKKSWNDKISSLKVHPYSAIVLYEHTKYRGNAMQYTNKSSSWKEVSFVGSNWNDRASSIEVIPYNDKQGTRSPHYSHLWNGGTVTAKFNRSWQKFNDEGWQGAGDPMGTLKGGESYKLLFKSVDVRYNPPRRIGNRIVYVQLDGRHEFKCTGYSESQRKVITATYSNTRLDRSQVSLWGVVFSFDSRGFLYHPQYGLVGQMVY